MIKQYSFLMEADSVKSMVKTPARDPQVARVGDPKSLIDNPDDPTNEMRKQAANLKAQAELIAAKAQLARTQHDAKKSLDDLKQQQADEEADRQAEENRQKPDPTVNPNA